MNRAIAMLIIGLVFGGGLGFVLAASYGVTLDGHDHAADHGAVGEGVPASEHAAHANHDKPLEMEGPAPTLRIQALPDPVAGWNLEIQTTNFSFSPQNAGLPHVAGEGHAHVYANGEKIGRVYGNWVHLGGLPKGTVEIMVTLNSNDHRPLSVGDVPVKASVQVEVPSGG